MLADWLPPTVRLWVYRILSTAFALELIFDVVPAGAQTKLVEAAAVLGFALAAGNTPRG